MRKKIQIEIWSDFVCPFCYIGKRNLENALVKFDGQETVEIIYKSFQLDPEVKSNPEKNVFQYLAERYGRDLEWSRAMHENVTLMAANSGLEFHFERAVIANSFDAHMLQHAANKIQKGTLLADKLFEAYFTLGKNIADSKTLENIAADVGMSGINLENIFSNIELDQEVQTDFFEATQLKITGVPYFVFNKKIALSGAQPIEVFLETLKTASEME